MRRPNHIILDFESNNVSNRPSYWAINHLTSATSTFNHLDNTNVQSKFGYGNTLIKRSSVLKDQQKFTIKSSQTHASTFLQQWERDGITNTFKPLPQVDKKHPECILKYSKDKGRDYFTYINSTSADYNKQSLEYLLARSQSEKVNHNPLIKLNTWFSLVNINLLRKERLYTKLKYSRSPAFDIVSGGAAALLAGFIGFLISEKFGYELVDSGDFYYLFMYLVFIAFSIRPLLLVSDSTKGFAHLLSLVRVLRFYLNLIQLLFIKLKK